jgi:hypothetical protein
VTEGGRFGGYGLFLSRGEFGIGRGKVVFLYNLLDLKRTMWEGPELEAGNHTIVFDFKSEGAGLGKGCTGVLSVDGKEVARKAMEHTTPITFPEDETFDIGRDTRTGVALVEYRYDVPFKFTGKINKFIRSRPPPAEYAIPRAAPPAKRVRSLTQTRPSRNPLARSLQIDLAGTLLGTGSEEILTVAEGVTICAAELRFSPRCSPWRRSAPRPPAGPSTA